ncbi:MAG: Murein DD-endopeptidase MepM [Burkholderia plantarii]|nr:MAG: Murein DD-endopeptidase MepM [Burkholderia plantarii]
MRRWLPATGALGAVAVFGLAAMLPAMSRPSAPSVEKAAATPQRVFAAVPFPSAQHYVSEQLAASIAASGSNGHDGVALASPALHGELTGSPRDLFSLNDPLLAPALAGTSGGVRTGTIDRSLAATLEQLDVPPQVRIQIGDLLDGHLHAHAPARTGDRYRVAFDTTPDGAQLTALEVRSTGQRFNALWFRPPGSAHGAFYTFDGAPLEAAALAMPVIATRISSPFGERIHPITHQRLMHTGVDLAAPRGTRVNAAADGVVSFIGTDPHGYGHYIMVQHADRTTTLYAHLSAYAKGLKVGMHVAQGQRIGAVGMTGAATGPHLHFEVRIADTPVDPIVALADASNALAPMQHEALLREVGAVRAQFAEAMRPATGLALLGTLAQPQPATMPEPLQASLTATGRQS